MKITIAKPQAIYEIGHRDNQEDSLYPQAGRATEADRVFILCDGMGGHEHGEVASGAVARTMGEFLKPRVTAGATVSDGTLLEALDAAYRELDRRDEDAVRKMGTTLCLVALHRGGATVMHIGDSRIYHIRPRERRLLYQSKDHSLVYDLYQAGEITYDQMATSPQKNIITRAMQPGEENHARPSVVHIGDLQAGDYLYICSDGMLEQMSNDALCALFSADDADDAKREELIAATRDNKDNHSAYFVRIAAVEPEADDNTRADDEQTSPDNALNIVPARPAARPDTEDEVEMVVDDDNTADVQQVTAGGSAPPAGDNRRTGLIAGLVGLVVVLVVALFFVARPGDRRDERPAPTETHRQQTVVRRPSRTTPTATHARKVKTKETKAASEAPAEKAKADAAVRPQPEVATEAEPAKEAPAEAGEEQKMTPEKMKQIEEEVKENQAKKRKATTPKGSGGRGLKTIPV